MSFAIIQPVDVTEAMLTSSSVAELDTSDPAEWNAATAYTAGQQASRATLHRIYQRLIDGTTATAPESDTANWVYVKPTNRWAMFDLVNETQTEGGSSLVVTLTPGVLVDSLAFDNVEGADSIRVQVADSSYDETLAMKTRTVTDWYEYFFGAFREKQTAFFTGLPLLTSNVITITITGTNVKVGSCVLGRLKVLGKPQYGAGVGIVDYSKKETDQFGSTAVVKRSYSKRMNVEVLVDNDAVDEVHALLSKLRATPVVWVGVGNTYDAMIVFGFYKSFEIVIAYPRESLCNLDVEGLT